MYFLKVSFDKNKRKFNTSLIKMNYSSASSANERLQTFYQHINCSSIEVTDITKDIDVIVDDEGLLVSGNPVLEVVHKKHPDRIHHLAGVLLFGKNKVSDDGVETVGFSNEHEAGEFIRNLKIKLIGITN